MEPATYLGHLRGDGEALAAAARQAPDAPIGSCPGWNMAGLVAHMAGVHRWAAEVVRSRRQERPDRSSMPQPPSATGALMAWYDEGLGELIAVLREVDPFATPVWSFAPGGQRHAGFWHRRMAQETTVHRWDAQAAGGTADPVDASLAVDGIDEYFDLFVTGRLGAKPIDDLHGSLHLHATDVDGEWWVALSPDHLEHRHEHAKADAAVRGPASGLLLWLWNRLPDDAAGLQAFGDPGIMAAMAALTF